MLMILIGRVPATWRRGTSDFASAGNVVNTNAHSALIVPVFFVLMGFRVDLKSFASGPVLGFAALITLVAILGKQICGLGVLERGLDRMAIGVGMIPRGEVGLIFAGMGSTLMLGGHPILSPTTFSALVLMIMLTTFITPPLLKVVFERK